jgi:hypothetical protein
VLELVAIGAAGQPLAAAEQACRVAVDGAGKVEESPAKLVVRVLMLAEAQATMLHRPPEGLAAHQRLAAPEARPLALQ